MKQYNRCIMDLESKWVNSSLLCMAGALFALAVYYFGLVGLSATGVFEAIFCLFLPLLLMVGYIVMIRFLNWNAPGLFAIIGLLFCLFLFFGTFTSGNIIRIILGVICYPLTALILVSCAGGHLPGKRPAIYVFPVAVFFRLVVFGLGGGFIAYVYEISASLTLAALGCLMMSFEIKKIKE